MNSTKYRRIKTINSHSGLARFLAGCSEDPVREIPRIKEIPSPYAYSPVHVVYSWGAKEIFVVETRHKYYEIFEVLDNGS